MSHEPDAPPASTGVMAGFAPGAATAIAVAGRAEDIVAEDEDPRTALRTAQERLRAAEDRFRALAANSGEILWTGDAEGRRAGDLVPWCAFTGQSAAEARTRGWARAIHPQDRARVAAAW